MADIVTLDLPVGGTAEVPLQRYATAGYVWQVPDAPAGLGGLEIVPRPGLAAAPGAATEEALRLRATAPGEHEVVLVLKRPWESAAAREIRVIVRAR